MLFGRKTRMGRILYVAFLCCYFSYVIFPLCYSAQVHAACGLTSLQAAHHQPSLKGVRLFLSELLLSLLQDDDDAYDVLSAAPATRHVLLAKKRGLSRSVKDILVKPTACAVLLPEPCNIPDTSPIQIHAMVRPVKGFQFCHSGIAPPLV
jgi:hypothetical protein